MDKTYFRLVLVALSLACFIAIYFIHGVDWKNQRIFLINQLSGQGSFCFNHSYATDLTLIGNTNVQINAQMNSSDNDVAFFDFVSKRHFACEKSRRFGNTLDGGWDLCLAEPFLPKSPCLVYSFGINNDFSFDDAISAAFNCTVRSFDPSMGKQDHRRSANVWFYNLGIGGQNIVNEKKWTLKTLPAIVQFMNDTNKVIDYLKMDVEDSEWPSIPAMLSDGTLAKVKQLALEIHVASRDSKSLYLKYDVLRKLENVGFRRWYFVYNMYHIQKTKNGFRSCCYEMVYINTRYLN